MSKLLNEDRFQHISYHHTDIRKTFARARKKIAEEQQENTIKQELISAQQEADKEEINRKVRMIRTGKWTE